MHSCICVWMRVWAEVCDSASGYLGFSVSLLLVFLCFFFCTEMQLIGLCMQVCELWEKQVLAQGLPLTFWPRGRDLGSLAHATPNRRVVATWAVRPQVPQRGFTRLVTPCWKVTTRRSRVQSSLLSCPSAFHHQHPKHTPEQTPEHTPEHTPAAAWHHRTHSQGVWRRRARLAAWSPEPLTADTGWARPEYPPLFSNEKSKTTTRLHQCCLTQLSVPGKNWILSRGRGGMSFNPEALYETLWDKLAISGAHLVIIMVNLSKLSTPEWLAGE